MATAEVQGVAGAEGGALFSEPLILLAAAVFAVPFSIGLGWDPFSDTWPQVW